jgi:hypothetical protein
VLKGITSLTNEFRTMTHCSGQIITANREDVNNITFHFVFPRVVVVRHRARIHSNRLSNNAPAARTARTAAPLAT